MDDISVDSSQLPPIGGTPQDNSSSNYSVDDSALPPIGQGLQDQAQPEQGSDWWGDYWGPLKDKASQAYYDSASGKSAFMPHDPVALGAQMQGRNAFLDDIQAGSAIDADADTKAKGAVAATRLAQVDHVLGVMGKPLYGDTFDPSAAPDTDDILQNTPHERLMASSRYRTVYDSAVPLVGEDSAKQYAKDTVAKEAHDVPYLRDSIFGDLMGMPNDTVIYNQVTKAQDAAAHPSMSDIMSRGVDAAGENVAEWGQLGSGALRALGSGARGAIMAGQGAVQLVDPMAAAESEGTAFGAADKIADLENELPEAHSATDKILQGAGSLIAGPIAAPLSAGAEGQDVIRKGGSLSDAEKAVAESAVANEAQIGAAGIPGSVAARLAASAAVGGGVEEARRAADGGEFDPVNFGVALAGGALGALGESPSETRLKSKASEMLDAAKDDPEAQAHIAYAIDKVASGDKNAMWGVAELSHIDKSAAPRNADDFEQWKADKINQPTEAETATPEAAETLGAAEDLVGKPGEQADLKSAIDAGNADPELGRPSVARDSRFNELLAKPDRTPEEHTELGDLTQGYVEQARVAHTQTPMEGVMNERARQRMLENGDISPDDKTMFLDLDDFKNVNDTHGYDVGNDVIQQSGESLARNAPDGVKVFHKGGDEFIAHGPADKLQEMYDSTNKDLQTKSLSLQDKDGEFTQVAPPTFSGGIGDDISSANDALKAEKTRKLGSGERRGRDRRDSTPEDIGGGDEARAQVDENDAGSETAETAEAENRAAIDESGQGESAGSGVDVHGQGRDVDSAAHEAATSPQNDLKQPTEAQTSAGNYRKGHLRMQGLDISVENPRGSTRSGVDENGQPWSRDMRHHYGYIKGTLGADGQHMDVLLGDRPGDATRSTYVIDQKNATGAFDEHKVMLGFKNQRDAERAYQSEYPRGWDRMGRVREMSSGDFKDWLKTGGREESQIGHVDPEVPRVTLRNRQPDSISMHAVTDSPLPTDMNPDGSPMPSTPNRTMSLRKRTYFADAQGGATGTHETVLNNLYDVDRDPRGFVSTARDSLTRRGLPQDDDHLGAEFERQVVQHGYDGYAGGGQATMLGEKVPTRAREESAHANVSEGTAEPVGGRERENAVGTADEELHSGAAREDGGGTRPRDENGTADENANGGQGIRPPDEPPRDDAHQRGENVRRTTKNADTEAMREEAGEPPSLKHAPKSDEQLGREARDILEKHPTIADEIANDVIAKPRALSDTEEVLLAEQRNRLARERDGALKRASEAIDAGNHEEAATHATTAELALDKLRRNWEAAERGGTEWGRGGRARQLAPDEEFTLERMLAQRKIQLGRELSKPEESQVRQIHEEISSPDKELKQVVSRSQRRPVSKDAATQARSEFDRLAAKIKGMDKFEQMTKECAL